MLFTNEGKRLFDEDDSEFLVKTIEMCLNFIEETTTGAQQNKKEHRAKLELIEYFSNFYNHGLAKNKNFTKFFDTRTKRLAALVNIKKRLGRMPTSDDFKMLFTLEVPKGFYRSLDKDIENLLSGN